MNQHNQQNQPHNQQPSASYLNMTQSIIHGTNNILNNQFPTPNADDNNILRILMDAY
ncbi:1506_t:CDS:1, partial [Ambispora gerdemannii]